MSVFLAWRGGSRIRNRGLLITVFCLAGCSHDVAFENPTTGATATCHAGLLAGINPWSQFDSCVENREAEGWIFKE